MYYYIEKNTPPHKAQVKKHTKTEITPAQVALKKIKKKKETQDAGKKEKNK